MNAIGKPKHRTVFSAGTGGVGKTAVVGVKERESGNVHAEVVTSVNRDTLHGIIENKTEEGSMVYTDQLHAYRNIPKRDHEAIAHNIGEYVKGKAHTNGIESFWATLRRAHKTTISSTICSRVALATLSLSRRVGRTRSVAPRTCSV